jgi:hypothetical protein
VYLPTVMPSSPATPAAPAVPAAVPVVTSREPSNPVTIASPGLPPPGTPAAVSASTGSSSKQVPIAAVVAPIVAAVVLAAALAGFLIHRRSRKRQLKRSALQWANSLPGVHDMPPPGPGSSGYPSVRPFGPGFGPGDVEYGGAAPVHEHDSAYRSNGSPRSQFTAGGVGGKPAMLQLPERYGASHYAASSLTPGAIHVGHVHSKDAGVAPSSVLSSSYSDSAGLSYEGSMAVSSHQSQRPLLPSGMHPRSGPAGSTTSSASGDAHSTMKCNELHAAAAAEAEARAASLAAMWETGKRGSGCGSGRGVAAAPPSLETMHEEQHQQHNMPHQQQQQQLQQQPSDGCSAAPPVARIFSSPFAHNVGLLPPLASTEPSASYAPPSGVFGPAALFGKHGAAAAGGMGELERVDELSGTLTRALAAGNRSQQQQQDGSEAAGSLAVTINRTTTPNCGLSQGLNRGPPTPSSKDHNRQAGYSGSDTDSKQGSRVSWVSGLVTQLSGGLLGSSAAAGAAARGGGDDGSGSGYSGYGDTQMSGLSGLTGMSSWAGEATNMASWAYRVCSGTVLEQGSCHCCGECTGSGCWSGVQHACNIKTCLQLLSTVGVQVLAMRMR